MKKYFLLLAVLAARPTLAQTAPNTPPTASMSTGRLMIGSDTPPEQRADEATTLLIGQLGLTPEQTKQVRAVELTRFQENQALLRKYEALHWSGVIPPAEGQAIEARFNQQLTAICTPAQNEKRRVMQARFRRLHGADSLQRVQVGSPR